MFIARMQIGTVRPSRAKMISLVERLLALHKSLASTQNPQDADRLTREVEAVDKAIDALVASRELYGLTEEEIKIIES